MSVAEYVAAFISILIGLALADLATSFQKLLRAGNRVRWNLLTPATAVLVTAFVINVWWSMFGTLNAMRSISVGATGTISSLAAGNLMQIQAGSVPGMAANQTNVGNISATTTIGATSGSFTATSTSIGNLTSVKTGSGN